MCKIIKLQPDCIHTSTREIAKVMNNIVAFKPAHLTEKKDNHTRFFALLKCMPGADKEQLIFQASDGKTESLTEFCKTNKSGYEDLLNRMQAVVDGASTSLSHRQTTTANAETRKLRSGVLKRMQKYGVDTTDVTKINAFLLQKRIAGKLLYQMSDSELQQLIKKLNAILKKQDK